MSAWFVFLILCLQSPPAGEPAAQALARASALKAGLRDAPVERVDMLRMEVVEAYRTIRRSYPLAREICAEAAFRAGELLQASGRTEDARREWLIASDQPAGLPFRDRARMELAHLERRGGRVEAAMRLYIDLERDAQARSTLREEALHWIGAMEQARGRLEDARRAWQRLAEQAEDPIHRIRAYDRIALTWLDQDDLEAAAGVLELCRRALNDLALEETRTGERVRTALSTMRALELLPQHIAKRREQRERSRQGAQGMSKHALPSVPVQL